MFIISARAYPSRFAGRYVSSIPRFALLVRRPIRRRVLCRAFFEYFFATPDACKGRMPQRLSYIRSEGRASGGELQRVGMLLSCIVFDHVWGLASAELCSLLVVEGCVHSRQCKFGAFVRWHAHDPTQRVGLGPIDFMCAVSFDFGDMHATGSHSLNRVVVGHSI